MSAPAPVRVVIGEDDVLMREGIARLLAEAGFEVARRSWRGCSGGGASRARLTS
jgi:FixJ family two-component response regulator